MRAKESTRGFLFLRRENDAAVASRGRSAIKSLLGVFAGNENELETYGLQVTVNGGGGTPAPAPATP